MSDDRAMDRSIFSDLARSINQHQGTHRVPPGSESSQHKVSAHIDERKKFIEVMKSCIYDAFIECLPLFSRVTLRNIQARLGGEERYIPSLSNTFRNADIRLERALGATYAELATKYGMTAQGIYNICNGAKDDVDDR